MATPGPPRPGGSLRWATAVMLVLALAGCTDGTAEPAPSSPSPTVAPTTASGDVDATLCPVTGAQVAEVLDGEFGAVEATVLDGAEIGDAGGDLLRVGCVVEAPGGHDHDGMVQVTYAYYVRPPVVDQGCRGVELQQAAPSAAEVEVAGLTDLEVAVLDITDQSDEYRRVQTLAGCFDDAPDQAALVQLVLADESDVAEQEQLGALLGMVVDALPEDPAGLADLVDRAAADEPS